MVIAGFTGDVDTLSIGVVTMAELHVGLRMARTDEQRLQRMARAGLAHVHSVPRLTRDDELPAGGDIIDVRRPAG